MPLHEVTSYKLNFGTNTSISIDTDSLEAEIETWLDDEDKMRQFWYSAKTNYSGSAQYDDPAAPLSAVIKSFHAIVGFLFE
uniref:Phage protein n=1 Tax=Angiostrongylus cantonensis TaxID=6313 RepID=A0A0K0CYA1_ANGCA